ncbi:hypothetical protein GGI35DRAFT_451070 [Trichoderma velutinum]
MARQLSQVFAKQTPNGLKLPPICSQCSTELRSTGHTCTDRRNPIWPRYLVSRYSYTGPPSTKTRSRLRHSRTSRRVAPFSPRHIANPDKPHPRTHTHPLARTQRTRRVPVLARPPRQRRLVPFLFRHNRPLPPFSIVSPLG